jgi:hypothetical protein
MSLLRAQVISLAQLREQRMICREEFGELLSVLVVGSLVVAGHDPHSSEMGVPPNTSVGQVASQAVGDPGHEVVPETE